MSLNKLALQQNISADLVAGLNTSSSNYYIDFVKLFIDFSKSSPALDNLSPEQASKVISDAMGVITKMVNGFWYNPNDKKQTSDTEIIGWIKVTGWREMITGHIINELSVHLANRIDAYIKSAIVRTPVNIPSLIVKGMDGITQIGNTVATTISPSPTSDLIS